MVMARAAYHACEDWREGPICFVASSGPPCGVLGVRLSRALLGASHLDPSRQSSRAYPRYFHTVVCDHDQIDGQRSDLPIASAATSGSWRAGESGCGESTAGRGSPPCSGSRAGACHQSSQRSGTVQHSPRYTAPLAAFTVLRSSAEISWTDGGMARDAERDNERLNEASREDLRESISPVAIPAYVGSTPAGHAVDPEQRCPGAGSEHRGHLSARLTNAPRRHGPKATRRDRTSDL
jgi:hypothetical protein